MALARLIALIAIASLVGRFMINLEREVDAVTALWKLFRFFTIWTVFAAALLFTWVGFLGGKLRATNFGAVTLYVTVVALIYHGLLYQGFSPASFDFWVDHGLHTAVPGLVVIHWLVYAPRRGLRISNAFVWLALPLAYLGFTLARGAVTGFYPYFFLDVDRFGYGQVALNSGGIAALFLVLGTALILAGRRLPGR